VTLARNCKPCGRCSKVWEASILRALSLIVLIEGWVASLLLYIESACVGGLTMHVKVSFAVLCHCCGRLSHGHLLEALGAHWSLDVVPLTLGMNWVPLRSRRLIAYYAHKLRRIVRSDVHFVANKLFLFISFMWLLVLSIVLKSMNGNWILIMHFHCQKLSRTCRIKYCSNPTNFANNCLKGILFTFWVLDAFIF
jgi:hypothetical protein